MICSGATGIANAIVLIERKLKKKEALHSSNVTPLIHIRYTAYIFTQNLRRKSVDDPRCIQNSGQKQRQFLAEVTQNIPNSVF